jgi:hypothetical protein
MAVMATHSLLRGASDRQSAQREDHLWKLAGMLVCRPTCGLHGQSMGPRPSQSTSSPSRLPPIPWTSEFLLDQNTDRTAAWPAKIAFTLQSARFGYPQGKRVEKPRVFELEDSSESALG